MDVGGKGFFKGLKITMILQVYGVDISKYAIKNAHPDIKKLITLLMQASLWKDNFFDLVYHLVIT